MKPVFKFCIQINVVELVTIKSTAPPAVRNRNPVFFYIVGPQSMYYQSMIPEMIVVLSDVDTKIAYKNRSKSINF